MLPDRQTLWNLYVVGIIRNINAILAGVYGDSLDIPASNRSRGERSDEVLIRLIHEESLDSVVKCLLRAESRIEKQGRANLHDLALGFTILCAAQMIRGNSSDRAAAVISSSMLLGQVIPLLRSAYRLLAKSFPDRLIGELSIEEISDALGEDLQLIQEAIDEAIKSERRAQHLQKLQEQLRRPSILLGLFSLIVDAGLDDRSFDDFLKGEK